MCECPFCTRPPTTELPVCVRLTHPQKDFAFWVMVCNFDKLSIFMLDANGGTDAKTFTNAITKEYKRLGIQVPDRSVLLAFSKEIKMSDGTLKDYDHVAHGIFSGKLPCTYPHFEDQNLTSRCDRDAGISSVEEMMATTPAPPPAPAPSVLKKKKPPPSRSNNRSKRPLHTVHIGSEGPTVVRHAPPPPDRGVPPRSPPRSPPRENDPMEICGTPYPASDLGGDPENVAFILDSRPEWDQEAVDELIRWGAKLPLLSVGKTFPRRHRVDVECVFLQPSGRTTQTFKGAPQTILQPLQWLRYAHSERVSHLA